jgi:putative ABC transport system substrate-binding protein
MRRRDFITLLGGAAAWPLAASAQRARVIGVIIGTDPRNRDYQAYVTAFEQVLRSLGWRNGHNLHIHYRWAAGDVQRYPALATETVELAPDLIVAHTTTGLAAVLQATRTIPIVFLGVSDPVAQGFVSSLTRPGGNITGFAAHEFSIGGKWLDLLKQFMPAIRRVALLGNPVTSPQFKFNMASIEEAGRSFGVEVIAAPIHDKAGIEAAIAGLSGQRQGGLILGNDQFIRSRHLADVVELAARHRVPAIYSQREFVVAGGLMCYGYLPIEQWRGVAFYVDRILKGAKPGDLPVQQPVKYELVINLKAAQVLGLELPMGLMLRADEVIE